jgi:serine/threonine protein kinase
VSEGGVAALAHAAGPDLTPKIADFGLARHLADEQGRTSTSVAVGTPEYMAPEQARADKNVGPACDVYGLGAVLYAALTGRPPFRGETPDLTRVQVMLDEPRRPADLRSDIPPQLEAICLKCLEKEPGRRYASAANLAEDLARCRQGAPPSVGEAGPMDWHARWARGLGYELLELIGAGRTGFLYTARQVRLLGRVVALKLLPEASASDPGLQERFHREAAAIARLHHPNIVQIYDFGERGGWSYFTMEYIDGGSLAKVFAAGPPPVRRAVELVAVVARAIDYAHERGHAHCSLRPASVGLTSSGHVKVARFGLARVLGEDRRARWAPLEDRRLPSYLAPEQVRGGDVGPATDVYGLGALLYGLLTGQAPFVGPSLREVREAVLGRDPVPPRQSREEVTEDVQAICLACLAKDPAARPPSARAVAEQLEHFLSR